MEIWKDIKGYEGLYQVSNYGRVKSLERIINQWNRFKVCKRHCPERLLKQITEKDGYYIVNLYKNGQRDWRRVHRLVAEAFIKNPNNLPYVNHKDLNKQNNCIDNLEWCTDLENKQHAKENGHIRKGKPIGKYDLQGNLIVSYSNARECAKQERLPYTLVRNWLYNKPKKNDFIFNYINDNNLKELR